FEEAQMALAGNDLSVPAEFYTPYFEQLEESVQNYERQFPGARCEDEPTCAKFLSTLHTGMTDLYKLNFGNILKMWCDLFYSDAQATCRRLSPRISEQYGTIYFENRGTDQFNSQSAEGKRFRQFVIQTLGQFRFTTEK